MTHDIYAGHEARVRTIGVTTGYHPRETLAVALPYLIVDSLAELQTHL